MSRLYRSCSFLRTGLTLAALSSVVSGCPDRLTSPSEDLEAITLTATPDPVTVKVGGQTSVDVTITRRNGYVGPVYLTAEISRIAGGGVTVANVTIPDGSTTGTMIIKAAATTTPTSEGYLRISGGGNGYASGIFDIRVVVLAAGSFGISVPASRANGNPGFPLRYVVSISRVQYTAPVTITVESITANRAAAPFTTRVTPSNTTGRHATLEIDLPSSAKLDTYEITLKGTGSDGQVELIDFLFDVREPVFKLTSTPPVAPIPAGGSALAIVQVERDPGFTGTINLSSSSTTGIAITPVTISPSETQTTVRINVPNSTTPGLYDVFVSSGVVSGLTIIGTFITFTVGNFALSVTTAPLDVTAGAMPPVLDTLQVIRNNFPGAISVTAATDPGITVSIGPEDFGMRELSVSAASSVSLGDHSVLLTATSGSTVVTKSFAVRIKAPVAPLPSGIVLTVNPRSVSVSQGRSTTISGVVTNGLNVTDVTWATRDPSIATIADNGSRSVIVTGVKAGSQTYIVGSYAYFGGIARDSALVTVTNPSTVEVASITIEPLQPSILNGQQVQFRVRYFNQAGSEMNAEVGSTTSFAATNSGVSQISSTTGLLTSRGIGSSVVTASYSMPYYATRVPPKAPLTASATVDVK